MNNLPDGHARQKGTLRSPARPPGHDQSRRRRPLTRGRKILLALTVVFSFAYLLVCLVPFVPGDEIWLAGLIALCFPYLLALLVSLVIWWGLLRSGWWLLPFLTILSGTQQIRVVFAFHPGQSVFHFTKDPEVVRVMQWNVSSWGQMPANATDPVQGHRDGMMDAIEICKADVLCLQECFEPNNSKYFSSNLGLLKQQGYGYHYFFPNSVTYSGKRMTGLAIVSRLPIIDTGKASFGNTPHSEGLMFADIQTSRGVVRIMNTHLESIRTGQEGDPGGAGGKGYSIQGMERAFAYRAGQADLVRRHIDQSPYPVIVCANLGDVPNSYAYFRVRGNLQDSFLKTGFGFGGTFRFLLPTLRLDYILAGEQMRVEQFNIPDFPYSDHYPLLADFRLR